jgi:hypothetical protein
MLVSTFLSLGDTLPTNHPLYSTTSYQKGKTISKTRIRYYIRIPTGTCEYPGRQLTAAYLRILPPRNLQDLLVIPDKGAPFTHGKKRQGVYKGTPPLSTLEHEENGRIRQVRYRRPSVHNLRTVT